MADNKKLYLDLAGLQAYDAKIKNYIDSADGVVDGKIAAEIQNRQAADKAINDIIGDWKSFDSELTITDAMNQLAGEDGILHGMQDSIDEVNAKIGDMEQLGELDNVVDAILMISDAIGNPDDLAEDTITESIIANANAIAAINNAGSGVLASAKAYTDTEVGKEKTRAEAVEKAINDRLGDSTKINNMPVVDALVNVAELIGNTDDMIDTTIIESINVVDDRLDTEVARAKAAEQAINDVIGNWKEFDSDITITEAISRVAEAFNVDDEFTSMADVVGLINKEEDRATKAEAALGKRIDDHAAAVDGKVATLVGEDEGKSVRKIANEELAAQLLSGNADADFKTLQELAAWLEDHPESVAEINEDIAELKAAVGEGGSVDAQIDAKIDALDSDATKTAGADGLALEVHMENGKLVSINGSIAANVYDAHGAAATAEQNAKTYADSINSNIGPIDTSEIDKLF